MEIMAAPQLAWRGREALAGMGRLFGGGPGTLFGTNECRSVVFKSIAGAGLAMSGPGWRVAEGAPVSPHGSRDVRGMSECSIGIKLDFRRCRMSMLRPSINRRACLRARRIGNRHCVIAAIDTFVLPATLAPCALSVISSRTRYIDACAI